MKPPLHSKSKASHKLLPCPGSWTVADSLRQMALASPYTTVQKTAVKARDSDPLLLRLRTPHSPTQGPWWVCWLKAASGMLRHLWCAIWHDSARAALKSHLPDREDGRVNDLGIVEHVKYMQTWLVGHLELSSSMVMKLDIAMASRHRHLFLFHL